MRRFLSATFIIAVLTAAPAFAQSAGGLEWSVPGGWRTEAAQSMRAGTYTAAPVPGETARAECAVYFFGPGQGGSVAANLDRWKGQFTTAAGGPAAAQVETRTANGLKMTIIDVSGTYSGLGGPMGGGAPAPGYRLLGAIVEGPSGSVFVKFAGPVRTIGANQLRFEQLLASFRRAR